MKDIVLIANGDLRESANIACWPAQKTMEDRLMAGIAAKGRTVTRGIRRSRRATASSAVSAKAWMSLPVSTRKRR
ncbi:hypothetical protein [Aliiruegeria lutimaris]|uniref:hypothetical protein n=1 Tax=Aliiruegeria lutimaris TaxID=571298 RepID=UPI001BAEB774|nr:hypothetical protein [Aliiruegeria lutimaris]